MTNGTNRKFEIELRYAQFTLHRADSISDDELWATIETAANENAATYSDAEPYHPTRENHVLYARNAQGETRAFIVWQEWDGAKAFIGLAWTHPGHRRTGLYRCLFLMLEGEALHRGLKAISCYASAGNAASMAAHDSLMKRRAVYFQKDITPIQG